jgi:serine O-acetyltransferase
MTTNWDKKIGKSSARVIGELSTCWSCPSGANTEKGLNLAGQQAVHKVVDDLISVLFPGCHGHEPIRENRLKATLQNRLKIIACGLKAQLTGALKYQCVFDCRKDRMECHDCEDQAQDTVAYLVESLPEIQKILQSDIVAAYEGDPAAMSTMEIVMSYPAFFAIAVQRMAHLLYEKKAPLIPRIMTEYAHSRTGIDIHPGAKIGPGFFIDHGTGVVIGETCTIGKNVKLYQGVTLGALSFEKDDKGRLIKGIKRHPNVEDNVVIYAGATILGGNTTIGRNSEIGGNVWLTHSVAPYSKVYNQQPKPLIRSAGTHLKRGKRLR